MRGFAPPALAAIEAFAGSLGLPARPGRDGTFSFTFDRSGTLSMTPAAEGDRILLSLTRRPDHGGDAVLRRALDQAGLDPTTNHVFHAGLASDGSIVLAVSLAEAEVSLPALDEGLRSLMARLDAVSSR